MRISKEETSSRCGQVIDLVTAVKELHRLTPQELDKSLKDCEDFTLKHTTEKGSTLKINLERLAQLLPVHLISKLVASRRDEDLFKYMLCGGRLLHTLYDLATRHSKLEQILLDDLKASEQLIDLVFYTLTVLSNRQEYQDWGSLALVLSALATCYLYLLPQILSLHWHELAQILVAHPKVDKFIDVAFRVVRLDIRSLQKTLSSESHDLSTSSTAEQSVNYLSQQCEASLQLIASLCHQKLFRERILKNKEVCREGILPLARSILNLKLCSFLECAAVVAAVSRLKSKIISILLQLCEVESPSYLDEVASYPKSLEVAKDIALEVLEVLKKALSRDLRPPDPCSEKPYPMGLLQPNALRLVDMLSDDSNFRSYIAIHFPEVLTAVVSYPHGEFLSAWCSSVPPLGEEDVSLEFDPFAAAGWILDSFSSLGLLNATYSESNFIQNSLPQASHAHYKTSLLIKIIANLHFFGPEVCKANEKNLFFNKFYECSFKDLPKASQAYAQKAGTVHKNLRSLLAHAESLVPSFVNEDDIQLFRAFFDQLQTLNPPHEFEARPAESKFDSISSWDKFPKLDINGHFQSNGNQVLLAREHENGVDSRKEQVSENAATRAENNQNFLMEVDICPQNDESSESDSYNTRGKNCIDQSDNNEFPHASERVAESGSTGLQDNDYLRTLRSEENRPRKRKRSVMNEKQISVIEKALLEEPDMQRKAASIQSWADKLCSYGSEVTSSQLKNWLNNRKARLARAAAKDVRVGPDGEMGFLEKQGGSVSGLRDSPENPAEGISGSSSASARASKTPNIITGSSTQLAEGHHAWDLGHNVSLINDLGEEIGKGKVHQLQGEWFGRKLLESCTCVIDVTELTGDVSKHGRVPFPSEATGDTFEETVKKLGAMCVVWDVGKMRPQPPQQRK
uniref:Homeobox domain-containing protein n=1 Tax=Kalanchoe fedtschenkoi TaxID=63787 RepID=A0A7N0ZQM5_KALFE